MLRTNKKELQNSPMFYILIALSSLNFLGRGSIFFFIFSVYALCRLFMSGHRIKLDISSLYAALLTIVVLILSISNLDFLEAIKATTYFLAYLVGYNTYIVADNKLKYIERVCFSFCLGLAVYMLITFIYNLNKHVGYVRLLYNVWNGEPIAATLIGLLSCGIIGLSFYYFFIKKAIWSKVFAAITIILVFTVNFNTATRTPIILFLIFYAFLYLVYTSSVNQRKAVRMFFTMIFILAALWIVIAFNIANINTIISESNLIQRFRIEGLDSQRNQISAEHFRLLMKYPWGGGKISNEVGAHAHNFIQEGHDRYGILALISLVCLSMSSLINVLRILSKKRNKKQIDYLLICMYIPIFVQMCLEPVFQGYPVLVMFFLMLHAIFRAYLNYSSENTRECYN